MRGPSIPIRLSILAAMIAMPLARGHDARAQTAAPAGPVAPPPVSPEDALRARFAGTYVPAPGVPNNARIDEGIEHAVQELFFAIRPLARSRIRAGNPLFPTVTIGFRDHRIDIDSPPVSAHSADNGGASTMTGLDHEVNNVTQRFDRGDLVQTCWNSAGRRVTRFVLTPDGSQLRLHVEITAPQLPVAVRYTLLFARR
jgi:hypothetical protein